MRSTLSRGVWGHAPPWNFWNLGPLRSHLLAAGSLQLSLVVSSLRQTATRGQLAMMQVGALSQHYGVNLTPLVYCKRQLLSH